MISGAYEDHDDPDQFFNDKSVQFVRDPILDSGVPIPGPDNLNVLINVFGFGKLTGQRYVSDIGGLKGESTFYLPGTGVIMSKMRHKVSSPLDSKERIDFVSKRGLAYFAFDHRLRPKANR